MNRSFILLPCTIFYLNVHAQKILNEGAALLFRNIKTTLTIAEKNTIYEETAFVLSKDKKQFVMGGDASFMDHPFNVMVLPVDMNKDGKEEIFLVFGNSFTSGMTGSNVFLFLKDKAGNYQSNFGFSGTTPLIIPTKNAGYPDLLIGGPGSGFPVWRWNGKEYVFNRKISGKSLGKIKTISVDKASKAYLNAIKQ